jgi:hypothetical protein
MRASFYNLTTHQFDYVGNIYADPVFGFAFIDFMGHGAMGQDDKTGSLSEAYIVNAAGTNDSSMTIIAGAQFVSTSMGGPQKPTPSPPAQPLPPNYRPPKDIEQPCIDRTSDFRGDARAIARMLHGSLIRTTNEGHRFPGAEINPRGQSFQTAISRLTKNGFVPATILGFQSFDHPHECQQH